MTEDDTDHCPRCGAEFGDWIAVGLSSDGNKRWHKRRCSDCDYDEGEWLPK